ncbi:hypothetical protein EOPP23_12890 [Endozoicomonas sp. OPT23]|uniref:hypothetical protein n=1 Tax=Endozoicomonas sp. OPT23 TaxID=2072845 RepID=UPI00129C08F1|nr:hypothetical protein [Endozoicomonas sp. OPT23]MRI33884.1 hypothetical protein [Endozoicomonas sp. OPT23]
MFPHLLRKSINKELAIAVLVINLVPCPCLLKADTALEEHPKLIVLSETLTQKIETLTTRVKDELTTTEEDEISALPVEKEKDKKPETIRTLFNQLDDELPGWEELDADMLPVSYLLSITTYLKGIERYSSELQKKANHNAERLHELSKTHRLDFNIKSFSENKNHTKEIPAEHLEIIRAEYNYIISDYFSQEIHTREASDIIFNLLDTGTDQDFFELHRKIGISSALILFYHSNFIKKGLLSSFRKTLEFYDGFFSQLGFEREHTAINHLYSALTSYSLFVSPIDLYIDNDIDASFEASMPFVNGGSLVLKGLESADRSPLLRLHIDDNGSVEEADLEAVNKRPFLRLEYIPRVQQDSSYEQKQSFE